MLRRVSGKLTVQCGDKTTAGSEAVDTVLDGISRIVEHKTEVRHLETALQSFIQAISDNLPEQRKWCAGNLRAHVHFA